MRPDDILDALGSIEETHIHAAGTVRRKLRPRWGNALAAAACIVLVLTAGIDILARFEFLAAGWGAWPGTIIDDAYFFRIPHSGIWKYTPEEGASLQLSTFWEDGTLINRYGLYFDRGRSLYVKPHSTGKTEKLYTADWPESTHIGMDLQPDGTVIVTVYNKNEKTFSQLQLDGATGEILETVTPASDYSALSTRYTQTTFQVGSRIVKLEAVHDSGLEWTPYTLTENGVSIVPEGLYLSQYPVYVGDDLYFDVDDTDEWRNSSDAVSTSERVLLLRPDGTTRLLERPRYYYCGGSGEYLFYVDHSAREDEDYASAVGCYEIATGEYWALSRKGGEEIDIYDFATNGQVLYSSCPWDDAQILWQIAYEDGRPVSLQLTDENIHE